MIRTQKYASLAYPMVSAIKGRPVEAKYRTLALTFPTMIMQSGLAQAVGFLMAKGKDEHQTMLEHVAQLLEYQGTDTVKKMHADILASELSDYQRLTRNALEATSWLKRYTQAMLESKPANPQD